MAPCFWETFKPEYSHNNAADAGLQQGTQIIQGSCLRAAVTGINKNHHK